MLKFWEYENDSFITQLKFFTTKSVSDMSKLGKFVVFTIFRIINNVIEHYGLVQRVFLVVV